MSLREEYTQQQTWRDWDRYLDVLPISRGQRVWDLGCGVGEMTRRFSERGLKVSAVDADATMVREVQERGLPGVDVQQVDLKHQAPQAHEPVDGVWCGFSLAYFVDAEAALRRWTSDAARLKPGAWIAVLEVDRMFTGHSPLPAETQTRLDAFEQASRDAGHYDFRMGSRVPGILRRLGCEIVHEEHPFDPELNFQGPATDAIAEAWARRFERMRGLRAHFGDAAREVEADFLNGLRAPTHACEGTLCFVVGRVTKVPSRA